MNTLAKCKCRHCDQKIEFDLDSAGATIVCPHCAGETMLFIPPTAPTPAGKPPPSIGRSFDFKKGASEAIQAFVLCMAIGLFVVGVSLVVGGCKAEIDESERINSSAIRQNVYVLQYCSGFILIGLSPIVFAAARLIAWFRDHGGKT